MWKYFTQVWIFYLLFQYNSYNALSAYYQGLIAFLDLEWDDPTFNSMLLLAVKAMWCAVTSQNLA